MKIIYILALCVFLVSCNQVKNTQEDTSASQANGGSEGSEEVEVSEIFDDEDEYTKEDMLEDRMQEQREKSKGLDFIGLTVEQAADLAKENGVSFRVVKEDGKYLAVTMDYRPGRINAEVEDGKVTAFDVE